VRMHPSAIPGRGITRPLPLRRIVQRYVLIHYLCTNRMQKKMECIKCRTQFTPVRHWQKYCSEKCRMSYFWDKREAAEERKPYANPISWHTPLDVAERNGDTGLTGYVTAKEPDVYDVQRRIWQMELQMKLMQKDHEHHIKIEELQKKVERLEQEQETAKRMGSVLDQFLDPKSIIALAAAIHEARKKSKP